MKYITLGYLNLPVTVQTYKNTTGWLIGLQMLEARGLLILIPSAGRWAD